MRRERKEKEEKKEEKRKKRHKSKKLQRKSMVIMVIINFNQAKLINEENWVEIETTEMRKNVKKKEKQEN